MPFSRRLPAIALAGAVTLCLVGPTVADACGSFFRSREVSPEQTPSLSREKVLLIYDSASKREHFIREVAFARAREPFGFVVPTPTRPEVAEVETSPFTRLRERFPFAPRPQPRGGDKAVPVEPVGSGVEVLEVAKVGSFTAFVLAANDAKALGKWLADNQLVSNDASDAWLAHYVDMGFYYVAMRYDPPADAPAEADAALVAETVRISFATPLPYYPYFEPTREVAVEDLDPRLLELWYVGTAPVVPVGLRERDAEQAWIQPLQRGSLTRDARTSLEYPLEGELAELLPEGNLVVQTYQDQKRSRAGFGDVLFAFEQAQELTPELVAELEPLLGILDPSLIEQEAKQ